MTAFDKKINQIATRHRWNIEKQARAAVPCYIIAAPTYEDAGKIVAVLNRCKGLHHETLTPIHYESWAVKVYDAGQIAAYRERERQKAALVTPYSPPSSPLFTVSRNRRPRNQPPANRPASTAGRLLPYVPARLVKYILAGFARQLRRRLLLHLLPVLAVSN